MTRILMVMRPDEGGAFEHVAGLARGVAARGHRVAVCGPLAHRQARLGVDVIDIPMPREISPASDLASLRGVAGAWRRFRPDLVHVHGTKASVYARIARAADPRTPLVYTPHGYPFGGYFTSQGARQRYRLIERALAPLASRVICVCEAERRLAAAVGPAGRTRVVHNGIGPLAGGPADPRLTELAGRARVIGTLTGLRPGKGVETLIDAMPEIRETCPEAVLAIAGGGPPGAEAAIEEHARSIGVADALVLLGPTAGATPLLRGIEVFAFPSWAESFPYAIIEAMSLGLPIVSTDVGGIREAIEHLDSGVLIEPRDPGALAAAVASLLSNPGSAAEMGERARRRQRKLFTMQRMIDGTTEVYCELSGV